MSRRDRKPQDLVLDPGVLREGAVCEFGGDRGVGAVGGLVVTPWRDLFLAAETSELAVTSDAGQVDDARFDQVVVHIQKSRAATSVDLAHAWRILARGGQLLLCGPNALGIVSAAKRLGRDLEQSGIVVSNRARARIVRFKKDDGAGPKAEQTPPFDATIDALDGSVHTLSLETRPGVFSAKKLDAGSQLLLENLSRYVGHKPPKRIADIGCGTGVLGLAAATLFEEAQTLLVDGDARAVACADANTKNLGLAERVTTAWWDAREKPVADRIDLALVNPPFHQHGSEVDLAPALALFDSLGGWLSRNGRALVVANRTLPWEGALEAVGEVEVIATARGYKLLSLKRSRRSPSARGRNAPGSRSAGRSRAPIRSR